MIPTKDEGRAASNRATPKETSSKPHLNAPDAGAAIIKDDADGYFGRCPVCCEPGVILNVGREHYGHCAKHRAKWYVGSNLFSAWRDEPECAWRDNAATLSVCRTVEPQSSPMPSSTWEPVATALDAVQRRLLGTALAVYPLESAGHANSEDAPRVARTLGLLDEYRAALAVHREAIIERDKAEHDRPEVLMKLLRRIIGEAPR